MPSQPLDSASSEEDYITSLTSCQGALQAFVSTLVSGNTDVEDIIQRVNLVLWKKRDQFEHGTNFKAWAFSIARWEVRAWFTEKKRGNWLVFDDEITDKIAEIHDTLDTGNPRALSALRNCLAKLNNRHRTLVIYFYQQGKTYEECASTLGSTESSLRVILHRIRKKLRLCIDSQLKVNDL